MATPIKETPMATRLAPRICFDEIETFAEGFGAAWGLFLVEEDFKPCKTPIINEIICWFLKFVEFFEKSSCKFNSLGKL